MKSKSEKLLIQFEDAFTKMAAQYIRDTSDDKSEYLIASRKAFDARQELLAYIKELERRR